MSDPTNPFVQQPARPYRLGFWFGEHVATSVTNVKSTLVAGSLGSLALAFAILPAIWSALRWRCRKARSSLADGFPVA